MLAELLFGDQGRERDICHRRYFSFSGKLPSKKAIKFPRKQLIGRKRSKSPRTMDRKTCHCKLLANKEREANPKKSEKRSPNDLTSINSINRQLTGIGKEPKCNIEMTRNAMDTTTMITLVDLFQDCNLLAMPHVQRETNLGQSLPL